MKVLHHNTIIDFNLFRKQLKETKDRFIIVRDNFNIPHFFKTEKIREYVKTIPYYDDVYIICCAKKFAFKPPIYGCKGIKYEKL